MTDRDTENNRKNNISGQDEIFDYEDLSEEDDFAEDDFADDSPEDGEIVIHFKLWMIPAFIGMVILAILICIPLWKLSHHNSNDGGGDTLPAVIVTEETKSMETVTEPETTAPQNRQRHPRLPRSLQLLSRLQRPRPRQPRRTDR